MAGRQRKGVALAKALSIPHIVVDGGLTTGPRHAWDPEEQARRMAERAARMNPQKTN